MRTMFMALSTLGCTSLLLLGACVDEDVSPPTEEPDTQTNTLIQPIDPHDPSLTSLQVFPYADRLAVTRSPSPLGCRTIREIENDWIFAQSDMLVVASIDAQPVEVTCQNQTLFALTLRVEHVLGTQPVETTLHVLSPPPLRLQGDTQHLINLVNHGGALVAHTSMPLAASQETARLQDDECLQATVTQRLVDLQTAYLTHNTATQPPLFHEETLQNLPSIDLSTCTSP